MMPCLVYLLGDACRPIAAFVAEFSLSDYLGNTILSVNCYQQGHSYMVHLVDYSQCQIFGSNICSGGTRADRLTLKGYRGY